MDEDDTQADNLTDDEEDSGSPDEKRVFTTPVDVGVDLEEND